MARDKKSIASFEQVAQVSDINNKNNNNKNDNYNDNDKNMDSLDEVLQEKENKSKTHILKGIYFEREVARTIDKITRGKGKGAKSDIVNAAVKKAFKEKGWM